MQQNYTNLVREGLGILWSLNTFKYYVYRRNPIVYCDYQALSRVFKSNKIPDHAMFHDWIARIMEYNVRVIHKPGRLMAIPDMLSKHYVAYDTEEKPEQSTEMFAAMVQTATESGDCLIQDILDKQNNILVKISQKEEQNKSIPDVQMFNILLNQFTPQSRGGGHHFITGIN